MPDLSSSLPAEAPREIPKPAADLPSWATITQISDRVWRLDLDGHLGDTRLKGSATAGSPAPLRGLVDTIAEWPGDADA